MSDKKEIDNLTNVDDFLGELNAGMFIDKLAHLLSNAALGTVLNGQGNKKGKVTCEFSFSKVGENDQIIVQTKMSHSTPTKRGKKSEDDVSDTPMFVGKGGKITIAPSKIDNQGQFSLAAEEKKNIRPLRTIGQ